MLFSPFRSIGCGSDTICIFILFDKFTQHIANRAGPSNVLSTKIIIRHRKFQMHMKIKGRTDTAEVMKCEVEKGQVPASSHCRRNSFSVSLNLINLSYAA